MATKKNNYITEELDWLEQRANEIKEEVETNPYNSLSDRIVMLEGAKGPSEKVVSNKEAQQKARREALKDYSFLIEAIGKLREAEEKKIEARGGQSVGGMMKRKIEGGE